MTLCVVLSCQAKASIMMIVSTLYMTYTQDLIRYGEMPSYSVIDGDIPCTPEVEQNYTYLFNICNTVSLPTCPSPTYIHT